MSDKRFRSGDYLDHILQAIHRIRRYSQGMSKAEFLDDDFPSFHLAEITDQVSPDILDANRNHSAIAAPGSSGLQRIRIEGYHLALAIIIC